MPRIYHISMCSAVYLILSKNEIPSHDDLFATKSDYLFLL